jgi:GTP pyrophosphokinase
MQKEQNHTITQTSTEEERKQIVRSYKRLIDVWHTRKETQDRWEVRKAFRVAANAHKDMRRKSGEPFIFHPIAVATIAAGELGLGRTSIIAALLHDTVEDTDLTLEDVEGMFGEKVARIIDGLTKIEGISETTSTTAQAETIKKILLTLSDDVRVILVKLADRLHNMRTLDAMPYLKQLKIASETRFIYAPLANRLGLYEMKTELEELSFRYSNPDTYKQIKHQIEVNNAELKKRYEVFKKPIEDFYSKSNKQIEIRLRNKSAYSIWKNMNEKEMMFEDIYLTPTVEIIVQSKPEQEKYECWNTYAALTSIFQPNNNKLHDLISQPKANGYSAVHATVMIPGGYWVNVQIRSQRMEEIATKGYAAYWKYKDKTDQEGLEKWLLRTKELLKETELDAIPFIDDFKMNLFSEEIYVFTPKGDLITLPVKATVLDFAYAIHTDLGNKCIGANVNHKLLSVDHQLQTGDQVEIITSKKNEPTEKRLEFVVTARAKNNIKQAIKANRKKYREKGEEKFKKICEQLKADNQHCGINNLIEKLEIANDTDLYYYLATDKLTLKEIKEALFGAERKSSWLRFPSIFTSNLPFTKKTTSIKEEEILPENKNNTSEKVEFIVPSCCHPIPGDGVVSISQPGKLMEIHRTNCEVAIKLMSRYGKKITSPNWNQNSNISFLAGFKLTAESKVGMIKNITTIIADDYNLNIRKFDLETIGEMVEAAVFLYVENKQVLDKLMKKLIKIKGVIRVIRIEKF